MITIIPSQWRMLKLMHAMRHTELVSTSDVLVCSNGFMNKFFVLPQTWSDPETSSG